MDEAAYKEETGRREDEKGFVLRSSSQQQKSSRAEQSRDSEANCACAIFFFPFVLFRDLHARQMQVGRFCLPGSWQFAGRVSLAENNRMLINSFGECEE